MTTSDLLSHLITLIIGIVIAAVSAGLTVYFALKRFHSEKWWERKAEAYSTIIEALHHVRNYSDTHLASLARGERLSDTEDKELTQKFDNAIAELRKRYDIGNFIISTEAVAEMDTLMKKLDESHEEEAWQYYLDSQLEAVNKCLASMRQLARTDLQLNEP